jgi:DNA-binding Lrp family transcriptional regulator
MAKAYVLMNTELGCEKEVENALKEIPEVKSTWLLYGVYDIIVLVEAKDEDILKNVIHEQIRNLEKVNTTMTNLII